MWTSRTRSSRRKCPSGTEGASAVSEQHEPAGSLGGPTEPLATFTGAFTVAPVRAKRRMRVVLLAVSAFLLVVSLAASLYIGSGSAAGFLLAFTASSPTARATGLPATMAATLPPATATAATATAKATQLS